MDKDSIYYKRLEEVFTEEKLDYAVGLLDHLHRASESSHAKGYQGEPLKALEGRFSGNGLDKEGFLGILAFLRQESMIHEGRGKHYTLASSVRRNAFN